MFVIFSCFFLLNRKQQENRNRLFKKSIRTHRIKQKEPLWFRYKDDTYHELEMIMAQAKRIIYGNRFNILSGCYTMASRTLICRQPKFHAIFLTPFRENFVKKLFIIIIIIIFGIILPKDIVASMNIFTNSVKFSLPTRSCLRFELIRNHGKIYMCKLFIVCVSVCMWWG